MRPSTIADKSAPSLDDWRWLTSPAAEDSLASAASLEVELTARAARLRANLSPARASLVLGQIELRRRARDKFSAADKMFFTAKGLEQATDEIVALYKAARLPEGRRVFDLCAGIGGDLVALARRCQAIGLDRDPICAVIADANARVLLESAHRPRLVVGEAADAELAECDAWHIDPDRRPRGRRTTRAALHEPSAETIDLLLARNPQAAVKLAPAAVWPEPWTEQAEMEWIGRDRACRQLVAWFGDLAEHPGQRRATVLGRDAQPARTMVGLPGHDIPIAEHIERYVFEPHAAVLAAQLTATLATEHHLAAIAPGIAYLTGPSALPDPALACFEVDDVVPFDLKRVRALLRARDIGRLEIKVRGVEQDPAELRRRLRATGDREATLLVTRREERVVAILARRNTV